MTGNIVIQFLNFFLIYAFLGWIVEVIYHAVAQGVVVNRGFLNGPVCPIYGFGMLLILYLLLPISENLLVLLIGGMLFTTSIELFGGWILEKLFHMRWWDYSQEPFNLHGYICVKFSLAWGLGVVGVVRLLHPMVADISDFVWKTPLKWLLIPLMLLFVVDIAATVASIMHLQKELRTLEHLASDMREISDNITQVIGTHALEADQRMDHRRVQAALGRAELRQQAEERRKILELELAERRKQHENIKRRLQRHTICGVGRIIAAYPHARLNWQGVRLGVVLERHSFEKEENISR